MCFVLNIEGAKYISRVRSAWVFYNKNNYKPCKGGIPVHT